MKPLRVTAVEKLDLHSYFVQLSDGDYVVVLDDEMADILLGRKEKMHDDAEPDGSSEPDDV